MNLLCLARKDNRNIRAIFVLRRKEYVKVEHEQGYRSRSVKNVLCIKIIELNGFLSYIS
jgi:hypothetical protein